MSEYDEKEAVKTEDISEEAGEGAESAAASEKMAGEAASSAEKVGVAAGQSSSSVAEQLGKLELVNGANGVKDAAGLKELSGNKDVNAIKDAFEKFGEKKLNPEAFLSRTEKLILDNLYGAVKEGDMKKVEEMLATLNENPKMQKQVMDALTSRLAGMGVSAGYEQGKDQNGNPFLRLHMSGSTGRGEWGSVTVGSDGRNSASTQGRGDKLPQPADAGNTFGSMMNWATIMQHMQQREVPGHHREPVKPEIIERLRPLQNYKK